MTLTYYDRTKPIIMLTHASKYSLGAVLVQNGCPIAFASKTLTDIESRYPNIKRVVLFCFGFKKVPYLFIMVLILFEIILSEVALLQNKYYFLSND